MKARVRGISGGTELVSWIVPFAFITLIVDYFFYKVGRRFFTIGKYTYCNYYNTKWR